MLFAENFSFQCTVGNGSEDDLNQTCSIFGKIDRFVGTGQASIQVYCTDGYHLDNSPAHSKNTPSGFEIIGLQNPGGPYLGSVQLTLDRFRFSTGTYGVFLRIYPPDSRDDAPRRFSGVCSISAVK